MFPSFRNNDLVSYSAHEFAFRMNLIICIDIMASNQFRTNNGMVSCLASKFRLFAWRLFVISSFRLASFRYFVFSPGVFSLFRLFAWRLFVISSFRLAFFVISSFRVASFRYFVFSRGVFSSFRLFAWRSGGAKRRNNARRKDEITKKRHAKYRKDEITPGEKTK